MIQRFMFSAAMVLAPITAQAQQRPAAPVTTAAAPAGSSNGTSFGDASALTESDLGAVTGREDIARSIASATQRNTVASNSVTGNSVTGNIAIDGNAFQNLQGLAVINANSGNNVAINSAMNVTINLSPGS